MIFKYRIIWSHLPVMRFIMTSFIGSLIWMLFGLKKKVDRILIRILFGLKKITQIRIRIRILVLILNYLNNIQIPNYSLTSASHEVHHDIIHGVPHTNVIRFEEKSWPNTNTNIIRFENIDRIRIRILFGLKKATEYEYIHHSVWKNGPNTNTNIIWLEKITRIRIRILVYKVVSYLRKWRFTFYLVPWYNIVYSLWFYVHRREMQLLPKHG